MSYSVAESALETIVKLVTGYSASNVSKGDYKVLGTGQTKAVVLSPGPFRRTNMSPGITNTDWMVLLELYIPFLTEISAIATAIRTERQAIIDKLDTYPTLNRASGIVLGALESGDEPELWQVGSRKWWRQVMRVTIREAGTVTYAE
ncbi:MAG: hypothetical protein FD153_1482 [Rhodospirillaceae bacterium]|nr:MAG: hypothetical protein FD153_1482 [Rhodospirillaceae bacterium]